MGRGIDRLSSAARLLRAVWRAPRLNHYGTRSSLPGSCNSPVAFSPPRPSADASCSYVSSAATIAGERPFTLSRPIRSGSAPALPSLSAKGSPVTETVTGDGGRKAADSHIRRYLSGPDWYCLNCGRIEALHVGGVCPSPLARIA